MRIWTSSSLVVKERKIGGNGFRGIDSRENRFRAGKHVHVHKPGTVELIWRKRLKIQVREKITDGGRSLRSFEQMAFRLFYDLLGKKENKNRCI